MQPETFPYLFTRYAGLPVNRLHGMSPTNIAHYVSKWQELLARDIKKRDELCNRIFQLISEEADEEERKRLLNLKRAVYNNRTNSDILLKKLSLPVQEKIGEDLTELRAGKNDLHSFLKDWDKVYDSAIESGRSVIKECTLLEPFQNAILLSSKDLYEQLENFRNAPSAVLDNRMWRTEFSVLRYLTRMAYKTSPFSTLTHLGLTTVCEEATGNHLHPEGAVKSKIRLNNKLLKRIKALMERHDRLNDLMYVSLNSSIFIQDGKLCYLMNCLNLEIVQRIPLSPINRFIFETLSDVSRVMTLFELVTLIADVVGAGREDAKAYLLKLVDAGMLELNLKCSEINPDWDSRLLEFLTPYMEKNEAASRLYLLLEKLQETKVQFTAVPVKARELLLNQVYKQLKDTIATLEQQAGLVEKTQEELKAISEAILQRYRNGLGFEKLPYIPADYRQEGIFYEDSFIEETGSISASEITTITNKLNDLCVCLRAFDLRKAERQQMLDFFLQTFGTQHPVPLIDFYQAYYKNRNTRLETGQTAEPAIPENEQQPAWIGDLAETLKNCREDRHGIHINRDDLSALPAAEGVVLGRSAFIQLYKDNNDHSVKAVVNSLMAGMGKLIGRFLHLFNEQVTTAQRSTNLALQPDIIMMELNDGSSFNANIHPPLLNYEVKMPSSNTIMDRSQQISVNRIEIHYQGHPPKLTLRDRETGREIQAYDLCLETLSSRSHLYQMLSHFNDDTNISHLPLIHAIDQYHKGADDPAIQVKPRITFADQIILRRKGWVVKRSALPVRQDDEKESVYFLKILTWLSDNGIPDDVFIFLKRSYLPKADPDTKARTRRDDYKPQYINFKQPLMLKLFARLLQRAGTHFYMEEVLPAILQEGDEQYRVSEHLLQWHNK